MIFSKDQFLFLKDAYSRGENLTRIIQSWNIPINFEVICFIYELQSGTYTEEAELNPDFLKLVTEEISAVFGKYLSTESVVLDCGTGEATTLIPILKRLGIATSIAIDSSISRLTYARKNAINSGLKIHLAVANIANLPLRSRSVDAVMTIHALEPNGGQEVGLLLELGRVSRKYVMLVEPDFERGSSLQQERMKRLNYISNIESAIKICGFKLLERVPLYNNSNIDNVASVFIIEVKEQSRNMYAIDDFPTYWVDPIFREELRAFDTGILTPGGLWFPVIRDIPLLRETDAQFLLAPAIEINSKLD